MVSTGYHWSAVPDVSVYLGSDGGDLPGQDSDLGHREGQFQLLKPHPQRVELLSEEAWPLPGGPNFFRCAFFFSNFAVPPFTSCHQFEDLMMTLLLWLLKTCCWICINLSLGLFYVAVSSSVRWWNSSPHCLQFLYHALCVLHHRHLLQVELRSFVSSEIIQFTVIYRAIGPMCDC